MQAALAPTPTVTHLRLIMTEENETTDTLAPPTDREPKTNPENEAPAPKHAMRPQPADPWDTSFLDADDSTFSRAVKMIADAARANEAARVANEATAAERKLVEAQHLKLQNEILTSVQRAEKAQDANFKIINEELHKLKASDVRQDGRLAQGDERFQQIEASIDELKRLVTRATEKIEALEQRMTDIRNAGPAPATPSPTVQT